ncbi:uncharacterized protein BX664DRAFT_256435 [Halteromyces radiatus]|uniref:uncharacterized protein n=1 Tax=Halteromyces radiatus TaxID=101107 RepID=UPI002220C703|nr:uncharacterized protein BX664DRAFT_256435 [Halteromyces radiatus]KAI8099115.1 hypothetical protein BX664DRAFT_256435 [Halteromyces radiatus]
MNNNNYLNSPSPTDQFTNPLQAIYVGNGTTDEIIIGDDNNTIDDEQQELTDKDNNNNNNNTGIPNSPPKLDDQGQPIKIRKKPGRKPNPASPALRKAQNRAAQRAFRERKERHLRDLELTIRSLRDQRNNAVKEMHGMKSKLDAFKAETWYLKGVVLTLQFVCLHHNIHIPTHSPYLTEETLAEMAKTAPHAIEAYVNAYTRNNTNLKPTMASHISNTRHEQNMTTDDIDRAKWARKSDFLDSLQQQKQQSSKSAQNDTSALYKERSEEDISMAQWLQQQGITEQHIGQMAAIGDGPPSSNQQQQSAEGTTDKQTQPDQHEKEQVQNLTAIQRIRLQLRIQSALSSHSGNSERLQPTILQLAIPHDPRIDLIPTPHMRDRMIIFRDQINYDECFDLLLNGTRYHGGDPTQSENWEMDPSFIQEYWFLMLGYDVHKTNKWRRLKGLPEIPSGSGTGDERWLSNFQSQHPFFDVPREEPLPPFINDEALSPSAWTDEVFRQMVESMPPLQPVINNNYPHNPNDNNDSMSVDLYPQSHHQQLAQLLQQQQQQHQQQLQQQQQQQEQNLSSPLNQDSHPFYAQLMGTPPEARMERRSPSLGKGMNEVRLY